MLTQRAPRTVVEDVFCDMKPLIDKIAVRFAIRYNQDRDECRELAYFHFLECYHGFRPERGTRLEQRIQVVVWNRLRDELKKESNRVRLLKTADVDLELIDRAEPEAFDADDFCSEMTDDAKTVVSLLFDTPGELLDMIRQEKPSAENPGAPIRRCLSRYCVQGLGWLSSRVGNAFTELEEALT